MTLVTRLFALALAALLGAVAWGYAQSRPSPPTDLPFIVSGQDLGFQIVGTRKGKPTGRLMVRVDGEWKEAEFAPTVAPIH